METDHSEIFIDNFCRTLDARIKRPIENYRTLLSTYRDTSNIIEFIKKEKQKIRESLSSGVYKHNSSINKYREYLEANTTTDEDKRKAILYFIYSMTFVKSDVPMKRLLNPMEFYRVIKTPFVKSYLEKVLMLEYNKFLSEERNRIDREKNEFTEKKKADPSIKRKHQYFIIAELIATNRITIKNKELFYKDIKYNNGTELSRVLNEEFKTTNKAFTQYLNDFKTQSGEKYFLDNYEILKKLYKHFSDNNINVINKAFLKAFEELKNQNLI